jgi:hypothetical protein
MLFERRWRCGASESGATPRQAKQAPLKFSFPSASENLALISKSLNPKDSIFVFLLFPEIPQIPQVRSNPSSSLRFVI